MSTYGLLYVWKSYPDNSFSGLFPFSRSFSSTKITHRTANYLVNNKIRVKIVCGILRFDFTLCWYSDATSIFKELTELQNIRSF